MAVVWRGQRSRVRLRCPDPLPSALWYTKNRREKEEKKEELRGDLCCSWPSMEGRLDVSIDDLAFDESRKDLGGQKLVGVDRHDVLVENDDVGKLAALERPKVFSVKDA